MKKIIKLLKIDIITFKFILVGIVNTIFGTAVMFTAYNVFHLSYWISSALNYISGSILSFFLNKHFTFKSEEKSVSEVFRFALNIGMCYLLAYGIAKPLVRTVLSAFETSVQENIAMLVGMVIFVGLNYFGQRLFVFRKEEEK